MELLIPTVNYDNRTADKKPNYNEYVHVQGVSYPRDIRLNVNVTHTYYYTLINKHMNSHCVVA